ncbi:MAG: hypothetical protein HYR94_17810 [Chloroflexi bacterium]|nr:hypothetical protein [Chloroflexota bacterium]
MFGSQLPQTHKALQLNDKMLELAENLFLEELVNDSLFACGDDFTSKVVGKFGLYETFNGEVISFQPKPTLNFILISNIFVTTGDLTTIQVIIQHLSDYELSVAA